MNKRKPPAPSHFSTSTRRWWQAVIAEYALEPHHLHLLKLACEALDRAEEARGALATHGTTYIDRFGAPRLRPEVAVERDSRLSFARLCRELDLDTEAPVSSRTGPPALRSNRRGGFAS